MVEKPQSRKGHRDAVPVARVDHFGVALAAAGFGHVTYAALHSAVDVVAEGEERVAAKAYVRKPFQPGFLFRGGQLRGLLGKQGLPGF